MNCVWITRVLEEYRRHVVCRVECMFPAPSSSVPHRHACEVPPADTLVERRSFDFTTYVGRCLGVSPEIAQGIVADWGTHYRSSKPFVRTDSRSLRERIRA